jgi:dTDP-4-dehydrorhamnose 3,5-epimerase
VTGDIDGVRVVPLKLVVNERGSLMEVQRRDDEHFPGFGQLYVTSTKPGTIKAWYRHHRQVDQIAAVTGRFELAMYDARPESPTRDRVQRVQLGRDEPKLVQIPPGVWHGFRALGDAEAFLLHLNNEPHAWGAVDEDRLPPDDPSIPYAWA